MSKNKSFYFDKLVESVFSSCSAFINYSLEDTEKLLAWDTKEEFMHVVDVLRKSASRISAEYVQECYNRSILLSEEDVHLAKEESAKSANAILNSVINIRHMIGSDRFIVNNATDILNSPLSKNYITDFGRDSLSVELEYNGKRCLVYMFRTNSELIHRGDSYIYRVALYQESLNNVKVMDYNSIYDLWYTEDFSKYLTSLTFSDVPVRAEFRASEKHCIAEGKDVEYTIAWKSTVDKDCARVGCLNPTEVFNILNYVVYGYLNRQKKKCSGSLKKVLHNIHKVCDDGKDVVIESLQYTPSANKDYEYKGGYHASPISHERSGYFRRSRGRGDYDLVDGEFVFVGGKLGKYSYVAPCHVNGRDGTIVYKV